MQMEEFVTDEEIRKQQEKLRKATEKNLGRIAEELKK